MVPCCSVVCVFRHWVHHRDVESGEHILYLTPRKVCINSHCIQTIVYGCVSSLHASDHRDGTEGPCSAVVVHLAPLACDHSCDGVVASRGQIRVRVTRLQAPSGNTVLLLLPPPPSTRLHAATNWLNVCMLICSARTSKKRPPTLMKC